MYFFSFAATALTLLPKLRRLTALLSVSALATFSANAGTIITGTISGSPFCPGSSVTVPFTRPSSAGTGNVYKVQLSDATGSFSTATVIGTLSSTASNGSITATIPAGTGWGTGYRMRVIGSNPADTGSNNAVNLTINGRLYVKGNASLWGNGSSWNSPLKTVDSALRIANNGGTCAQEIWVAAGTYYPMSGANTATGRSATLLILRNAIKLYGGFAGTETVLSQRDITANLTILSGDLGLTTDSSDNAYHVVTVLATPTSPIDTNTRIDGFTISGGNATGTSFDTTLVMAVPQSDGGGISLYGAGAGNACGPFLRRITFQQNSATNGAGLGLGGYASGSSSPYIDSCSFIGNTAGIYGGGIYATNSRSSKPIIRNSVFTGNKIVGGLYNFTAGAAAYFKGVELIIAGCTIQNNTADWAPGFRFEACKSNITSCVFIGNSTTSTTYNTVGIGYSGESYTPAGGAGYHCLGDTATYRNCTISNNSASTGAGIAAVAISGSGTNYIRIDSCRLQNNSVGISGAAIYAGSFSAEQVVVEITNCAISDNTIVNNSASGNGAALRIVDAAVSLNQCVITGNSNNGPYGGSGGIHCTGSSVATINQCTIYNNYAANAATGKNLVNTGTVNINNSLIWCIPGISPSINNSGTFNAAYSSLQGVTASGTNISAYPQFANPSVPAGADGVWGTADDGLRLLKITPALNAGSNALVPAGITKDFANASRIQGGTVDMGVYEGYVAGCPGGARLYVDSAVLTSGTGTGWGSPFKTVWEALSIANDCPAITEIWVAKGSYYPMQSQTVIAGSRDSSLRISRNGLKLYGGFANGDTALSQRNLSTNATILSGDISTANDSTDNSYHVMTIAGPTGSPIDTSTVINGFTITKGNANGSFSMWNLGTTYVYRTDGGGIDLAGANGGNSSPKLENIIFTQNYAVNGGALYSTAHVGGKSSPVVRNCSFTANSATGSSGAYHAFSNGLNPVVAPEFYGCTFSNNTASSTGGAISMLTNTGTSNINKAVFSGCTFTGNTVSDTNGYGAAVYITGTDSTLPQFVNCLFGSNSGTYGSTYLTGVGLGTVSNCTFTSNANTAFGALTANNSATTISNSRFTGNVVANGTSNVYGGAAMFYGNAKKLVHTITNCRFTANSSYYQAGAIQASDSAYLIMVADTSTANKAQQGGFLQLSNNAGIIATNCYFNGDTATNYGAIIRNLGSAVSKFTKCHFLNGYTGNTGGVFDQNNAASLQYFNNCVFYGNKTVSIGGALHASAGIDTLVQCVFANNAAIGTSGSGGALSANGNTASVTVYNSTFSENTTGSTSNGRSTFYANTGGVINLINSVASGNAAAHFGGGGTLNLTNSLVKGAVVTAPSLSVPAVFINPALPFGADGIWGTADDGLYLAPCSPGVNAGANGLIPSGLSYDFGNLPRIQFNTVDMGAYEQGITGTKLYVNGAVPASGYGFTWGGAFKTVTEALSLANRSCLDTIWVAAGTYYPTTAAGTPTTIRDSSFRITRNGIQIYGGFAGSESLLAQRNVATNITILSGDIGLANDTTDNAYHVFTITTGSGNFDSTTRIDGFTITKGTGGISTSGSFTSNGLTFNRQDGGGLYLGAGANSNCSPTIANCIFIANAATSGGGMYCNAVGSSTANTSPTITSCAFSQNRAISNGGAMLLNGVPGIIVIPFTACTFSNNITNTGNGAAISANSDVSGFSDCSFSNNTAATTGSAIYGTNDTLMFTNCSFTGNVANNAGLTEGGAITSVSTSLLTVTNCGFSNNTGANIRGAAIGSTGQSVISGSSFTSNYAGVGGAISSTGVAGKAMAISGCTFTNNASTVGSGGAMYCINGATMAVSNSLFTGNTSVSNGGAYAGGSPGQATFVADTFASNKTASSGGAVYCTANPATVSSCVFTGNKASGSGGGVFTNNVLVVSGSVFTRDTGVTAGALCAASGTARFTAIQNFFQSNVSTAGGSGGAIQTSNNTIDTIVNNVFVANRDLGTVGGGAMNINITTGNTALIANNTMYADTTAGSGGSIRIAGSAGTANIYNNLSWRNLAASNNDISNNTSGTAVANRSNNYFNPDPLFTNPTNPNGVDGLWGTADDGLQLQACSQAIAYGINAPIAAYVTDARSAIRIQQTTVDAGAYESSYTNTVATPTVSITANPAGAICSGTNVVFTATLVNGGTMPQYQWLRNGLPVGTSASTYADTTPTNGSTIQVRVLSNAVCRTVDTVYSNIISETVNTTPIISSVSMTSPTTCGGTDGTITLNGPASGTTYSVDYSLNGVPQNTVTLMGATPGVVILTGLAAGSYSGFSVTTAAGCASLIYPGPVVLSPPTAPPAPVAGNNGPLCSGATLALTASATPSGTYSWTGPNGFTASSQNPSISNSSAAASGIYSVTVTVANCTSPAGMTTVTLNPTPGIASVTGISPATCGGVSGAVVISGLTNSATYTIAYIKGGIAQTPVTATASAGGAVTIGGLGAGNYAGFVVTLGACSSAAYATGITLTDPLSPATPLLSSNTPVCSGVILNLFASGTTSGLTYSWSGPNSFTSATQNVSIAGATTSASGTYTLTVTDPLTACATAVSTAVVVNLTPAISASAFTNPTTCSGTDGSITLNGLSASNAYIVSYTKTVGVITTPASVSITTNASGALVISGLSAATYTGISVSLNGCSSNTVASITLNDPLMPAPPTAFSNSPVCQGLALNLSATGQSGATYQWTGPNGFMASSQNPTITNMQATAAGVYSVTQTIAGCVSPATTTTVAMSTVPATPGTISGNASPCAGQSYTYSILPVSTAISYTWTTPTGSSWSTAGSTTTSIALTIGTANGILSVVANNVCGPSLPGNLSLNVNTPPAQPGAISGPTGICNGTAASYTIAPVANTASYTWSIPSGWSGGGTGTTISAIAAANSGTISVVANNVCGTSAAQSLAVTVAFIPVQPGTISGSVAPCISSTQTYSVAAVNGATSYAWNYPAGGSPAWLGGSLTNSLGLTVGSASGAISVSAVNQCGTSQAQSLTVAVVPVPAQPGAISGKTAPCVGAMETYKIATVAAATYYVWSYPVTWAGASVVDSINTLVGSTAGVISVSAANICGTSAARMLTVVPTPVQTPSVVLSRSTPTDTICAGTNVSFTATAINGGSSPQYAFLKNGVVVLSSGNVYTDGGLANGDRILVKMASSLPCVSASQVFDSVTMVVNPLVMPGININTVPPTTLCAGAPLTFTTNIVGGGPAPAYQWYKNGSPLSVTTPTYTSSSLSNGDTIQVRLTSSATCPALTSVLSNKVGLTVNPIVNPSVTISASPNGSVPVGTVITFSAIQSGGGQTPGYQWMKNGTAIPGETSNTYTTSNLKTGDRISLRMLSYDPCTQPALVTSNELALQVGQTGVATINTDSGVFSVRLYPNPTGGHFTVETSWNIAGAHALVDIINIVGQSVYHIALSPGNVKSWSYDVWLRDELANGQYMLRVIAVNADGALKTVVPFILLR